VIDDDVPHPLREAFDRELAPGEELLWLERPVFPRRMWLLVVGMVAFGIYGATHAIPAVSAAARGEMTAMGKPVSATMGVLITSSHLLGALGFLTAPLAWVWSTRNAAYAITNRRVLVMRRRLVGGVKRESIPAALLDLTVERNRGGVGDIVLVAKGSVEKGRENRLVDVRDVQATEAALRRLIQSSSKSSL
jgi:hypothetical protein